jgi:hypothetical protein
MTIKKVYLVIVSSILVIFINGCCIFCFYDVNEWKDDHPELFTLAVHSLLGVQGNEDDTLVVMQTDAYGRILFSYETQLTWTSENGTFGLLIAQKTENDQVYFYPDICFIQTNQIEYIIDTEIEALKSVNDWGNPLQEEKMDWLQVARLKETSSLAKAGTIINNAYQEYVMEEGMDEAPQWQLQTMDHEGRGLYVVFELSYNDEMEMLQYGRQYFFIISPDGSFDSESFYMEITDQTHFQTALSVLKTTNGWNTPLKGE